MNTIDILLEIKADIAKVKREVQEATGSFKYDDCYQDCLKIIDAKIARIENEQ